MKDIIIAPSLLACDFMNIEQELKAFDDFENLWFHLDIMDGHFVPNLTFGIPIIKMISKLSKHPLDAHLMVTNPRFHMEAMKDFGLHNITFHLEAEKNSLELVKWAKKHYPSVGISIKPNTKAEELSDDLLAKLDLILIMSVEPGFGGQKFIESAYDKARYLSEKRKNNNYTYQLQIDGGVNGENSPKIIESGINNLVAGSYVFKGGPTTYSKQVESLRS